jgi:hypothetical protein
MRPAPPARPVHAGSLAGWERLAFAVVFALMLAFVVVVTISSARARGTRPVPAASAKAGARAITGDRPARATWDRRLAAALAPVLRGHTGSLAVGVIDRSTGAVAVYGRRLRFRAAGIIKPEILAAVLLQRPPAEIGLSSADEDLATQMMEAGDHGAASRLWNLAGGAVGLAAADARLGLRHTTVGQGEYWGQTTTTVGDQLTMLSDLTAARSPLSSTERAFELSLMRNVEAAQRWGVFAAASPGRVHAIKNGGLREGRPGLWVINSIGVLEHGGQRLLMAVLSNRQPTEAAGIAEADGAAVAAATCMTSGR